MQEKCRVQSWDHLPEQLCVWQLGGQEHLWTDLARMILRVSLSLPGETRCKLNVEEEAVMRVSLQKRPHILPLLSVHSWAVTWEHCLLLCTPWVTGFERWDPERRRRRSDKNQFTKVGVIVWFLFLPINCVHRADLRTQTSEHCACVTKLGLTIKTTSLLSLVQMTRQWPFLLLIN